MHTRSVGVDESFKRDSVCFSFNSEELWSISTTHFGNFKNGRHETEGFHEGSANQAVVETAHVFLIGPFTFGPRSDNGVDF